jgi:hypothetical protein
MRCPSVCRKNAVAALEGSSRPCPALAREHEVAPASTVEQCDVVADELVQGPRRLTGDGLDCVGHS